MKKASVAPRSGAKPGSGGIRKRHSGVNNGAMVRDVDACAGLPAPIPNLVASYEEFIGDINNYVHVQSPEWLEADIQAEKWATKHAFEESEIFRDIPISLRSVLHGFKRIPELQTPGSPEVSIVLPQTINGALDDEFYGWNSVQLDSIEEDQVSNTEENVEETEDEQVEEQPEEISVEDIPKAKSNKFCEINQHLKVSELMRNIMSAFSVLLDVFRSKKLLGLSNAEDISAWECIYPKGKDGLPVFNSSGKYAVKLFHLGSWRKVIIDDRIPVNAEGKPLFVSSHSPNEVWPLLVTKAICKITCQSTRDVEFAQDFNIIQLLTGMIPEQLAPPSVLNEKYFQFLQCTVLKQTNRTTSSASPNRHSEKAPSANSQHGSQMARLPFLCIEKGTDSDIYYSRLIEVKDSQESVENRLVKVKCFNCFPNQNQDVGEVYVTLKELLSNAK